MKKLAKYVTCKGEMRTGYATIIEFVGKRPMVGRNDNIKIKRKEIKECGVDCG
jgi:hypothetical protein